MPIYCHFCEKCNYEFEGYYPISKDQKEVKCEKCEGETQRLISRVHIGWEGKIYRGLVNSEVERAEAAASSHMGSDPYSLMPDEVKI